MKKIAVLGFAVQPDRNSVPAEAYHTDAQWQALWDETDRLVSQQPKRQTRDVVLPTGLHAARRVVLAASAYHAANQARGLEGRAFGPPAAPFHDDEFVAAIWAKRK